MLKLVKVKGGSMLPTLSDGDYILTKKPRSLRPGFIYTINHIDLGLIVKRLDSVEADNCSFTGDNLNALSETLLGSVSPDRVIGQALLVIKPSGLSRL